MCRNVTTAAGRHAVSGHLVFLHFRVDFFYTMATCPLQELPPKSHLQELFWGQTDSLFQGWYLGGDELHSVLTGQTKRSISRAPHTITNPVYFIFTKTLTLQR